MSNIEQWYKKKFADAKQASATRKLRNLLARNIELARNHSNAGLKPGDKIFKALAVEAFAATAIFCEDFKVDVIDIEKQVPGYQVLQQLAYPNPQETRAHQIKVSKEVSIAILCGGFLLSTLIGLYIGWGEFLVRLFR